MKKGDVFLIIIAAAFLFLWFIPIEQGGEAAIYVDGKIYSRLPLEKDCELNVKSDFGENTVSVKNGTVTIIHADCPDKLCEKEKLDCSGGSIVCLPNRLSIIIENIKSDNKADVLL